MSRIYQQATLSSGAVSKANGSNIAMNINPSQLSTANLRTTNYSNTAPKVFTNNVNTSVNGSGHHSVGNGNVSHHHQQQHIENKTENASNKMATQDLQKLIERLENVTSRLEHVGTAAPAQNGVRRESNAANGSTETYDDLPSIVAFDDIGNNALEPFVQLSTKLGADVKTIVDMVKKLFNFERAFLIEAAICSQPSPDVLNKFYQTFAKNIEEITSFREKNRKSEFFNHLSAISESIGAFGWICVSPAPSPYVKEMSDSAQFYTNRVLKDYKEKDPQHATWVKLLLQMLAQLQAYVKQYHTTGVVWNSSKKGGKFDPAKVGSSSTNGAGAGGPPPPPPPPMPDFDQLLADDSSKKGGNSQQAAADALFAEINKGGDITKHLKQVRDDQKTHKNPNLRGSAIVPAEASAKSDTSKKNGVSKTFGGPVNVANKPPVLELVDKKWKVEYQQGQRNLVIDQTDLKHTVYVYQCKECTLTVKGKVNSILIDSCQRVDLLFDDVLSTVEFINSRNVQMQVLGRVPTVAIEKTDGCQVYLGMNSLETEIVSSKSTAMNVLVPSLTDEGEFTEQPVPEQFKTVINPKNRKLVTTQTEMA